MVSCRTALPAMSELTRASRQVGCRTKHGKQDLYPIGDNEDVETISGRRQGDLRQSSSCYFFGQKTVGW